MECSSRNGTSTVHGKDIITSFQHFIKLSKHLLHLADPKSFPYLWNISSKLAQPRFFQVCLLWNPATVPTRQLSSCRLWARSKWWNRNKSIFRAFPFGLQCEISQTLRIAGFIQKVPALWLWSFRELSSLRAIRGARHRLEENSWCTYSLNFWYKRPPFHCVGHPLGPQPDDQSCSFLQRV